MSTSLENAVRWAARQRHAADGPVPTIDPITPPEVQSRLAALETLVDEDRQEQAASAGLALLRELDAAALVTWIQRQRGQRHPPMEEAIESAIQQVEQAIRQGLFDGCVDAAEQEVAGWDRHLVHRDRHLWSMSRFWPALAQRRAWLEPAIPDQPLPPLRRPMPWPRAVDLRAAAATTDAGASALPTLITCQPEDGTWKAILRLPPEPGGPVRVRVATLADQPLTGTVICCGEQYVLDGQGCVQVPWELVAAAWNDGGVWVERTVDGVWVTAVAVALA